MVYKGPPISEADRNEKVTIIQTMDTPAPTQGPYL